MVRIHRSQASRWAAWLALAVMLALGVQPRTTRAANATLNTIQVANGGELAVRATGFDSREIVNTWVSGTDGSVIVTENGVATQGGVVYMTIRIGRFWRAGWWALTLRGSKSGSTAIATFEILPTPPDGPLASDRVEAYAQGRINFRGTGFAATEVVRAWATLPDGSAVAVPGNLRADASGDVYFSYDVPANAPPGTWYMTAYGLTSQRLLASPFTVLAR